MALQLIVSFLSLLSHFGVIQASFCPPPRPATLQASTMAEDSSAVSKLIIEELKVISLPAGPVAGLSPAVSTLDIFVFGRLGWTLGGGACLWSLSPCVPPAAVCPPCRRVSPLPPVAPLSSALVLRSPLAACGCVLRLL